MSITKADIPNTRSSSEQGGRDLLNDVEAWAQEHGWHVVRDEDDITAKIGTHGGPALLIDTPGDSLVFETFGDAVRNDEQRISFYGWPSLYRLILRRKPGQEWRVWTESGVFWPNPWGRETFLQIAEGLIHAQ